MRTQKWLAAAAAANESNAF